MKTLRCFFVLLAAGTLMAQTRLDSNQMRNDLFAGMAGNADALKRISETSAKTLADNPDHAQALVWHGIATLGRILHAGAEGERASGNGKTSKKEPQQWIAPFLWLPTTLR